MPNANVTVYTWNGNDASLGGLIHPAKAAMLGGNGGHVAVKVTVESTPKSDVLIQELREKNSPLHIREIAIETLENKEVVLKKGYEVYFSFREEYKDGKKMGSYQDDKSVEREGREFELTERGKDLPNAMTVKRKGWFDRRQKEVFSGVNRTLHLEGLKQTIEKVYNHSHLEIEQKNKEISIWQNEKIKLLENPLVNEIFTLQQQINQIHQEIDKMITVGGDADTIAELNQQSLELQNKISKLSENPIIKEIEDRHSMLIIPYLDNLDKKILNATAAIDKIKQYQIMLASQSEQQNNIPQPTQFFIHDILEMNKLIEQKMKYLKTLPDNSIEKEQQSAQLNDLISKQQEFIAEKFTVLETMLMHRKVELEAQIRIMQHKIAIDAVPFPRNQVKLDELNAELTFVVSQMNRLDEAKVQGVEADSIISYKGSWGGSEGLDVEKMIREGDAQARSENSNLLGMNYASKAWAMLITGVSDQTKEDFKNDADGGKHLFSKNIQLKITAGNLTSRMSELTNRLNRLEKKANEERIYNDLPLADKAYHHLMRVIAHESRRSKNQDKLAMLTELTTKLTQLVVEYHANKNKDNAKQFVDGFIQIANQLENNSQIKRGHKKVLAKFQAEMKKENPNLPFPKKKSFRAYIREKVQKFKDKLPRTGVAGFFSKSAQILLGKLKRKIGDESVVSIFRINVLKIKTIPRITRFVVKNINTLVNKLKTHLDSNQEKQLFTDLLRFKSLFALYTSLPLNKTDQLDKIEKELNENREKLKFYEAKASIYQMTEKFNGKKLSANVAEVLHDVGEYSKAYSSAANKKMEQEITPVMKYAS